LQPVSGLSVAAGFKFGCEQRQVDERKARN
jgi:hypothetical protein